MNRKRYTRRASRVAFRRLGDEVVIMSIEDTAFVFSLNKVAAIIWEAADGITPLDEIVDRICSRFDVAPEAALEDAQDLVEKLAGHGILNVSDTPIAAPSNSAQES